MAADCFWCKSGITGSVPFPVGNLNEAIGCCVKCQVFSCGHHAIRNTAKQEFKCYKCLVITLISTALVDSTLTSEEKKVLQTFDRELTDLTKTTNETKYGTYEEFELSTPELRDWFPVIRDIEIDWLQWPTNQGRILSKLPDDKLMFLKAAAYILSEIEGADGVTEIESPFRYTLLQSIQVKANSIW